MRLNINTGSLNGNNAAIENNTSTAEIKNALLTKGLSEGQLFRGNIQDIIGNNVKINLGDGKVLSAVLENGVNFNIGEDVNFLVKSNSGNRVLLQAVSGYNQSEMSKTILNFLNQSGLSVNDTNVNMVKEMMSYNMMLDSESLGQMEKLINTYSDADISTIVAMKSHDIPITQENINQFVSYKSYEHKITENISKLAEELVKLADKDSVTGQNQGILKNLTAEIMKIAGEAETDVQTLKQYENHTQEAVAHMEVIDEAVVVSDDNRRINQDNSLKQSSQLNENSYEAYTSITENMADNEKTFITISEDGQNIKNEVLNGQPEKNDLENGNIAGLTKDVPGESITELLKKAANELKSRWSLDINGFDGKRGEEIKTLIKENYESMSKGVEKLMETLKNHGMEKTDAYKSAENVKNNMQFMNDLNHMASYVQIPFKAYHGEKSGELYVYNRNKNKSISDGPITAFLHLDMEHLGATDVKVTMENKKVTTKFTLDNPVSQDIVEKHLPWLKERLEKQGYSVELTSETIENKEKLSPFEKILEVDRPKKNIKRYGFDIRL